MIIFKKKILIKIKKKMKKKQKSKSFLTKKETCIL